MKATCSRFLLAMVLILSMALVLGCPGKKCKDSPIINLMSPGQGSTQGTSVKLKYSGEPGRCGIDSCWYGPGYYGPVAGCGPNYLWNASPDYTGKVNVDQKYEATVGENRCFKILCSGNGGSTVAEVVFSVK